MIQFIAAAAVGVGVYAASKLVARELKRVGAYLDEQGERLKDQDAPQPVRLERDETTGRYRPVEADKGDHTTL